MKKTITIIDPKTKLPIGTREVEPAPRPEEEGIPPTCYATTDLPFAAFLRCQNVNLRSVQRDGHKSTLVFDDVDFCMEMARRWANEEDTEVQATVYSRELAKIKTLAVRGGF